jgi:hypothetical protein
MQIIVLQRFGQFYDFHDGTWNNNLVECYAPFTTNTAAMEYVMETFDSVEPVHMFDVTTPGSMQIVNTRPNNGVQGVFNGPITFGR